MRIATAADVGELAGAISADAASWGWQFEFLEKVISGVIERGTVVVLGAPGAYVGSVGLERATVPGVAGAMIRDRWFHVSSARRSFAAARALQRAALAIARRQGVPLVLGIYSRVQAARKMDLMARLGGELVGASYRWDP